MDSPGSLERDAARALATFAVDAYSLAVRCEETRSADRLVAAYHRALLAAAQKHTDGRYWFAFYAGLDAFVRVALDQIATPYSQDVLRALISFTQILDDDYGRRRRAWATQTAAESALS